MSAIITLDDGRTFPWNGGGMLAMYEMVALALPDDRARLGRWLVDLTTRNSPAQDFDLRGLTEGDREAFWTAADLVFARLVDRHGPNLLDREDLSGSESYGAWCLHMMFESRRRMLAGEPPGPREMLVPVVEEENIDDLWNWCQMDGCEGGTLVEAMIGATGENIVLCDTCHTVFPFRGYNLPERSVSFETFMKERGLPALWTELKVESSDEAVQ